MSTEIENFLNRLESGEQRSAIRDHEGNWSANTDVKKGILEVFKNGNNTGCTGNYKGFVDKHNLPAREFKIEDGVRLVPGGSSVRRGACVKASVIIMPPAYVNIGAFIDEGSMVDSHALVGSCAQIGKNVHLSAGVQIGGVLEPIGLAPVIIEDNVFIGAGSVIVEGIVVRKNAVIAPGVTLSKAVAVYDCVNEKILERGADIPENAVVVPGSRPVKTKFGKELGLQISTPIIIKYRDDKSNASLALEEALR